MSSVRNLRNFTERIKILSREVKHCERQSTYVRQDYERIFEGSVVVSSTQITSPFAYLSGF